MKSILIYLEDDIYKKFEELKNKNTGLTWKGILLEYLKLKEINSGS
jgi:hypothetical protein